jgi:hypothetical protein
MQEDLKNSVEALNSLKSKQQLCDSLMWEFKSEIKRMSLAISRAKGDMNTCGIVRRLLSSGNLSFDELILLRDKVREDFDQSFSTRPQAKIVDKLGPVGSKISEYKAGIKG